MESDTGSPFNESHRSRQIQAGVSKQRCALQNGFFDQSFKRIFEREALSDPVRLAGSVSVQKTLPKAPRGLWVPFTVLPIMVAPHPDRDASVVMVTLDDTAPSGTPDARAAESLSPCGAQNLTLVRREQCLTEDISSARKSSDFLMSSTSSAAGNFFGPMNHIDSGLPDIPIQPGQSDDLWASFPSQNAPRHKAYISLSETSAQSLSLVKNFSLRTSPSWRLLTHIDDGNHMTVLALWAQNRCTCPHPDLQPCPSGSSGMELLTVLPLGLQCWQRKALCCSQCADSVLEAVAAERLQSWAPREWPVLHSRWAGLVRGRTPSY
ncbi:hypothetical protein NQZ68_009965 [Dissostichus eleginoides]|nr:hypothetical protein NQZ68_009965 [Dissostichus eleginoides]